MNELIQQKFLAIFGHAPYPFQARVIETLLVQRKNVLLHVPTGGGKTLAAVAPFLLRSHFSFPFPNQIIYSFPLRTLVNAVQEKLKTTGIIADISVQTGENPEDPYFLKEMVLTTLDQSLSAFLNLSIPVSERLANINSGAMIGSYLVFDEFHLFDPQRSFLTTIKMLEMIKSFSPFLIMTATLPKNMIEWLRQRLDLEVITLSPEETVHIPNLNGKKKLHLEAGELTANEIVKHHRQKTLVIVNSVRKAQRLFLQLQKRETKGAELILLHSLFLKEDRKKKEAKVLELFGKDSIANVICIATQVIEAGLDISCDVLLTDNAPMDSLIQRFGRLARYSMEEGDVYIYKHTPVKPYTYARLQTSWQALQSVGDQMILTHDRIEWMQEEGLSQYYAELIQHMEADSTERYLDICNAMNVKVNYVTENYYSDLIRQIETVSLTIHANPEEIDVFQLERFQVQKYFLYHCYPKEEGTEWVLKAPLPQHNQREEGEWRTPCRTLSLQEYNSSAFVVANPRYVSYDETVGLMAGFPQGNNLLPNQSNDSQRKVYQYQDILWQDHAFRTVLTLENRFSKQLQKAVEMFQSVFPLVPQETLLSVIKLTLLLHDTGKLNQAWQKKVKGNHLLTGSWYSHTAGRVTSLPGHSAIGAFIIESIIKDYLADRKADTRLIQITSLAIATHHGTLWPELKEYTLVKNVDKLLKEVISEVCTVEFDFTVPVFSYRPKQPKFLLAQSNPNEFFCYLHLVRLLRLSDQYSFEEENLV